MAEFLSQDEIDALLDIADAGEEIEAVGEDQIVSKEKTTLFMILKSLIESLMSNLKLSLHFMIRC